MHTPHGVVDTPGFVAVGTNAALKFVDHRDADAAGLQLMFANTFHLLVHPGPDVVAAAGGLHKFMGRDRPIITDSGGFQIFSLKHRGELAMPGEDGRDAANVDGDGDDGEDRAELKCRATRRRRNSPGRTAAASSSARRACSSDRTATARRCTSARVVDRRSKGLGADIIIPLDEFTAYRPAAPSSSGRWR